MTIGDLARVERLLATCPDCPACKAVAVGAIEAGHRAFTFMPRNPARSMRGEGIRVNAPIITFGEGDKLYSFSIHRLQTPSKPWNNGAWRTKMTLVLESLLAMSGAFYFIDVPGFNQPPLLLVVSSSDLIDSFFNDESRTSVCVSIPLPICDTDKFPFGKHIGNWSLVPTTGG